MKITVEEKFQKPVEAMSITDYVTWKTSPDGYSYEGAVEMAQATAREVQEAFGRLVERLAESGALTGPDVVFVATGYPALKVTTTPD